MCKQTTERLMAAQPADRLHKQTGLHECTSYNINA